MSETIDYLASAKACWDALSSHDGSPEMLASFATTAALISIAESLAVLAGDLREERLRSESLRGALVEARREAEDAAGVIADVVRIINGDGTDIHRIAAIHRVVTE